MSRKWKNKWRLCMSLTWERKKKRTMRSNRRETWGSLNLPPWLSTSYIDSIYFFHYVDYKLSLYTMVKMGKLAYMRGGYVQFSPKMCRKLQPLVGFNLPLKYKFKYDVMVSCYSSYNRVCMHVVFLWENHSQFAWNGRFLRSSSWLGKSLKTHN